MTAASPRATGEPPALFEVPPLPGHFFSSAAFVSADGSVIAGSSSTVGQSRVVQWTTGDGTVAMPVLSGTTAAGAGPLSADGSVAYYTCTVAGVVRSVRWSPGAGLQDLGEAPWGTPARFQDCTPDGALAVGTLRDTGPYGVVWTAGAGYSEFLPGVRNVIPDGVSDDGSVVVGLDPLGAFRWTAQHGVVHLPPLFPGGSSWAKGVTPDGRIAAGRSSAASGRLGYHAVRWLADGRIEQLANRYNSRYSDLFAISADGSSGVGDIQEPPLQWAAYWDEGLGLIKLDEYLAGLGVDLTGWSLEYALAISDDGTVLAGVGTLNGVDRGWVVRNLPHYCRVDLTRDGFVDFFDLDGFIERFEQGAAGADFNQDGFVAFFDYGAFIDAFETGC